MIVYDIFEPFCLAKLIIIEFVKYTDGGEVEYFPPIGFLSLGFLRFF